MTLIRHCCSDKNIFFSLLWPIALKESTRASISSLMLFGACWCWSDWIPRKNPRSSTFMSGLFGGWQTNRIWKPSLYPSGIRSRSSGFGWGLALSCWTKILMGHDSVLRADLRGHDAWMVGNTCSIRNRFVTSLFTVSIGFVSIVPAGRFLDERFTATL